jgi:hypothetical protein
MNPIRSMCVAGAMLAVAGCTSYSGSGLVAGQATEEGVRAAMGKPTDDFRDDGHHYLDFARGPIGFHTFRASFDAAGRLEGIEQILTLERFARIQVDKAMRDDVRKLIGSPGLVTRFPRTGIEYWDYRYLEDRVKMRLYVGFDGSGRVVKLERLLDPEEVMAVDGPSGM